MSIFVDNQCYTALNDLLDSSKKLREERQIDKSQKGLCEKSDENSFLVFSFLKFFNLDSLVKSIFTGHCEERSGCKAEPKQTRSLSFRTKKYDT